MRGQAPHQISGAVRLDEKKAVTWTAFCNGAGERTRTSGLLITNQLLYQLSYTSAGGNVRIVSGWSGADADDDVHAFGHHAARQPRQSGDTDVARIDVGQRAGIDVVEMMVRCGIRVVEHLARVDDDLADQLLFQKQIERVVDRRLGGLRGTIVGQRQYLIGR